MRTWIVIPCFNEAERLDVLSVSAFLASSPDVGLVLVNDGSEDATLPLLRRLEAAWPRRIEVLDQQPNQGKAEAVRQGLLAALRSEPTYVGYFDADLATPLETIPAFVDTLERREDVDLVMGARVALLGRAIERRPVRHVLGRVFATAASLVLDLPVYDTQCGAKLLRVTPLARALLDRPFGSRWIFDVELIARYLALSAKRRGLYELPLEQWTDVGESRVKTRDFVRAVGEMASIYRDYRLPRRFAPVLGILSAPFVRYAAAGSVVTALQYLALVASVEVLGLPAYPVAVAGTVLGALANYVVHYHLTFASTAPHARSLPRFLSVAALSIAITALGMSLATRSFGLHYLLAQALCTAVALVSGYALNKTWSFRDARLASSAAPVAPPRRSAEATKPADEGSATT